MPAVGSIDSILIYDGAKPIPRTLTFCGSCGEWLVSSLEAQQVEELIAAIRLVVSFPAFAGARLESADRPDIRLHVGGRSYGPEVTGIVRGGTDALNRARWRRRVLRTARLLRRSRGLPPVWVSVRWNGDPPPGRVDTVAALFVNEIEPRLAARPLAIHETTDVEPWELSDEAARYVHGFHVVRTQQDDQWVAGYTVLAPVPPDELQEKIKAKDDVIGGYTAHPDGLWLLVYAEAGDAAQDLELTQEAEAWAYATRFDRVFFLSSMNKVSDLRQV